MTTAIETDVIVIAFIIIFLLKKIVSGANRSSSRINKVKSALKIYLIIRVEKILNKLKYNEPTSDEKWGMVAFFATTTNQSIVDSRKQLEYARWNITEAICNYEQFIKTK